jgi:5-methylcytosine-specific restriction endonuclease McrA
MYKDKEEKRQKWQEWYAKNKEKRRAYDQQKHAGYYANPEKREKILTKGRAYIKDPKVKAKRAEYMKGWHEDKYTNDPEWVKNQRAKVRAWHKRKGNDKIYVEQLLEKRRISYHQVLKHDKEFVESNRKRSKKWNDNALSDPKYRAAINERNKQWFKNNPDKARLMCSKRRAHRNRTTQSFTLEEWMTKVKATQGICPRCKKYVGEHKITIDHIVPLSRAPDGFVYTIDDVQPMCKSCNTSKGTRANK